MKKLLCVTIFFLSFLCPESFAGESSGVGLTHGEIHAFSHIRGVVIASQPLSSKFDLHNYDVRVDLMDKVRAQLVKYNDKRFEHYGKNLLRRKRGGIVGATLRCYVHCYAGRKSGSITGLNWLFGKNREECVRMKIRLINDDSDKTLLQIIVKAGDRVAKPKYRLERYYSNALKRDCRKLARNLVKDLSHANVTSASSK